MESSLGGFGFCYVVRGARRFCLPADPAFCLISFPHPPDPRSQSALPGGKGVTISLFRRGLPPPAPLHLTACGTYRACQTGTRHRGSLRFGVKPTERLSLEQSRQPRRGGTGGEELSVARDSHATAAFEMVLSPGGRASQCRIGTSPQRIFALSFYSSKGIRMPRAERREQKSRTRSGR